MSGSGLAPGDFFAAGVCFVAGRGGGGGGGVGADPIFEEEDLLPAGGLGGEFGGVVPSHHLSAETEEHLPPSFAAD